MLEALGVASIRSPDRYEVDRVEAKLMPKKAAAAIDFRTGSRDREGKKRACLRRWKVCQLSTKPVVPPR